MQLWEGSSPRWFQTNTGWDTLAFMTSCGLCLHSDVVWVASPEVLPYKPEHSRWNSTLRCLVCWNLRLCQTYSKGHNFGLSFELEASPESALISKSSANVDLRLWLWSQGSPRDVSAMLLAWIFQDQVFKTCVTIVYAKKQSLELTAGLQMGSHNGACIRPQAFADNQGQCCVWPRALKSGLLKGSSSPTPASEPLCHQLRMKTRIFLTGSLCSGIALAVLSSNARKWLARANSETGCEQSPDDCRELKKLRKQACVTFSPLTSFIEFYLSSHFFRAPCVFKGRVIVPFPGARGCRSAENSSDFKERVFDTNLSFFSPWSARAFGAQASDDISSPLHPHPPKHTCTHRDTHICTRQAEPDNK